MSDDLPALPSGPPRLALPPAPPPPGREDQPVTVLVSARTVLPATPPAAAPAPGRTRVRNLTADPEEEFVDPDRSRPRRLWPLEPPWDKTGGPRPRGAGTRSAGSTEPAAEPVAEPPQARAAERRRTRTRRRRTPDPPPAEDEPAGPDVPAPVPAPAADQESPLLVWLFAPGDQDAVDYGWNRRNCRLAFQYVLPCAPALAAGWLTDFGEQLRRIPDTTMALSFGGALTVFFLLAANAAKRLIWPLAWLARLPAATCLIATVFYVKIHQGQL
ncbi:hypothetical protein ACPC54_18635 [Kitasatospora sp. NPDC094028]